MVSKSALVEWQEEGYPLGFISLRSIEDPRLSFESYKVGFDRDFQGPIPPKF